ncbi:two component transcriptional regulator winged helix family [Clostridium sp. CAG:411]|jgi:two-component system response regulator protein BraR/BceR|nr:response regulator transcription factor [Lachnospiraceae bacterium]CDE42728.1 two component transcriptional regulator winged helix family [Clostridium sp. CAG:411]
MAKYRILIVEDDEIIAKMEKEYLEKWEYKVFCVSDFKNILNDVSEQKPDLILMDVQLPYYNGFYWCSEIRKFSKVPIMFVSSKNDEMNIVMAMDMGGDEFIEKPFSFPVLTAKINALLRRSYSFKGQINMLEHKNVRLNLLNAIVFYGEQQVELTKNEFKILQILMENAGEMVTREQIMQQLWEDDSFIDDNTLTVNVTRIRKKLRSIGVEEFIMTKKGIGYFI